jgi:hypothetical protein
LSKPKDYLFPSSSCQRGREQPISGKTVGTYAKGSRRLRGRQWGEIAATGKIHQSQNQPVRTFLDDAGEALLVISETEEGANQE